MTRSILTITGLLVLVFAPITRAQDGPYCRPRGSYEQIRAAFPDAVEMMVRDDSVQVFQKPTDRSETDGKLPKGKQVLVYRHWGPWVQIATVEKGHTGYVKEEMLEPVQEED